MKPRFILIPSLLALTVFSACASAPSATASVPNDMATIAPAQVPASSATPEAATSTVPPSPVQVIATSRGAELEATDPNTVSLASGQLQLVEFFRFTWSTCRAMAPMVHGLEAEYFGRVKFSYLDADDPQTNVFQGELGFYYQPEFYFLDAEGNLIKKLVGYISEDELRRLFDANLQ
jgi:thiol-disulfide isomerase/thioredoxin